MSPGEGEQPLGNEALSNLRVTLQAQRALALDALITVNQQLNLVNGALGIPGRTEPDDRGRTERKLVLGAAINGVYLGAGLRQVDVAKGLDVSQSTVSDWKRGAFTPNALQIIEFDLLARKPAGFTLFAAGLLPTQLAPFYEGTSAELEP
ncbi:MAG TPA: helix-turn-helix transcriptional regulator [Candidatus Limnocylindria bacterium]|nr:helix-turn-helix transcriptional regulator [Candidatus Limnocylindria bacterium]